MSAKLKELLEKAELLVTIAQGKIVYNNGALLVCYKRLALNCAIEIAGHTVPLTTEMLSVAVSGRKRKDTHLCTAEEVAQELERILASSAPSSASNSEQKAS